MPAGVFVCNLSYLRFFALLHERAEREVSAIKVSLGDELVRRVHGDDGNAETDRVDVEFRDEHRNRPAARVLQNI